MSLNLNKVILAGRLVADPELKQTQSGISVVSLRIAVNRRYTSRNDGQQSQPEADFFNVTAWRTTAEFIARFFRKGSAICVVGSIQNRNWVDQQGVKHYATDIVADEANFVENRNASAAPDAGSDTYASAPAFSTPGAGAKFEELKTDDDLPF